MLQQQLADAELVAPVDARRPLAADGAGRDGLAAEAGLLAGDHRPKWVRAYVSEPDLGKRAPGHDGAASPSTAFPAGASTAGSASSRRSPNSRPRRWRPRSCAPAWSTRSGSSSTIPATSCGWACRRRCICRSTPPTRRRRSGADDRVRAEPPAAASAATCARRFRRDTGETVAGARRRLARGRARRRSPRWSGPDGAGKTTLLRLVAGLMTADAGDAAGPRHRCRPPIRRQVQDRIGYMPQRFGLYEDLTRAGKPRSLRRPARRDRGRAARSAIRGSWR